MKILAIGGTRGNLDVINKHIEKSGADIVLCTGDLGILYRPISPLPKVFDESNFYEYLEGTKKFLKPVYTVRGLHDNLSLCSHLTKRQIRVDNFYVMGNKHYRDRTLKELTFSGIGGGYSPKCYVKDKLVGGENRYFTEEDIAAIKPHKVDILLMHDLIGECSKKKIMFSEETFDLLDTIVPKYCLVGKYHWWGKSKLEFTNVIMLPRAEEGYLLIDTEDEWNATGVRFDI